MQDHPFQSDPHLDALLDEALSPGGIPGGIPAGLDRRILEAMAREAKAQAEPVGAEHAGVAVVARIGFFSSANFKRFAAAVLVALGIGAVILFNSKVQDQGRTGPMAPDATAFAKLEKLKLDVELAPVTVTMSHDTFALADNAIDHRIDTLKARANNAALTAGVDNWSTVADTLEAALDALDAEADKG